MHSDLGKRASTVRADTHCFAANRARGARVAMPRRFLRVWAERRSPQLLATTEGVRVGSAECRFSDAAKWVGEAAGALFYVVS